MVLLISRQCLLNFFLVLILQECTCKIFCDTHDLKLYNELDYAFQLGSRWKEIKMEKKRKKKKKLNPLSRDQRHGKLFDVCRNHANCTKGQSKLSPVRFLQVKYEVTVKYIRFLWGAARTLTTISRITYHNELNDSFFQNPLKFFSV